MSNVNIFLTYRGKTAFFWTVGEAALVKVSRVAREAIKGQSGRLKRVDIVGAAPGALKHVLKEALQHGQKVRITIHKLPVEKVVAILEAINVLELEPAQPHVEDAIVHHIAKEKITASEMVAIHQAFGHLGENSRSWRVMVHQLGWDAVNHEHHNEEEIDVLAKAAQQYPDLDAALQAKYKELAEKKMNGLAVLAAKKRAWDQKQESRERAKARGEANKRRAEHQKRVEDAKRRDAEYWEHRMWQERVGERPASEETVEYLLQEKPRPYYFGEPKRGKKCFWGKAEAVEKDEGEQEGDDGEKGGKDE